jgi:acylglycerol lipase
VTASTQRVESQIELSGAGFRHRRAWLPDAPDRSMILVHGYAEHCGRYDEMAMHFSHHGFAVHAYDQSGHGRSPGPRGDVDRFDRMLDELARFVDFVIEQHPNLPVTLVGHSMGGLVAAATCAFRSPMIDKLILSATLLEIGPDNPPWKRVLARLLAPLGSRVGFSVGLDPRGLSRDPDVARRYEADPFVKDRMSARFAVGMMSMLERTRESATRLDRPVLILHGEDDPMSDPAGSRAFHAGLAPEIAMASRLKIYPELRHEIFQEPERRIVWQDMLGWVKS